MGPTTHVLLIRNAAARRGGADLAAVRASFEAAGWSVHEVRPRRREDVATAVLAYQGRVDRVVVAGGDGSLNAAAPGLVAAELPLGIIPLGTANDLARTLAIPTDPAAAAGIVVAGHTSALDLGSVNGRPFFNVASIGLSAELTRTLTSAEKRRWGRLSYVNAAVRVFARARPFHARITHGGGSDDVLTLQIAVGNGRHYGGGNVVAARAAIDDGQLDLYSLEFENAWKLAPMLRAFRRGVHGAWHEVRTLRDVAFEVATRRPRPVNADGELITQTPAHFRVHPAALRVFAPRG
ncbi:MAG: lipid kinase [Alphaproteobacteria bacterium]